MMDVECIVAAQVCDATMIETVPIAGTIKIQPITCLSFKFIVFNFRISIGYRRLFPFTELYGSIGGEEGLLIFGIKHLLNLLSVKLEVYTHFNCAYQFVVAAIIEA